MLIVVMGVAAAGKTTVGRALAAALGWPFFDADEFHPPANVARMRRGAPLSDADRAPWLAALVRLVRALGAGHESAVLACSALRRAFREDLAGAARDADLAIEFVWLRVRRGVATERARGRGAHFMPAELIDSQFEALEAPSGALEVEGEKEVRDVVRDIISGLRLG